MASLSIRGSMPGILAAVPLSLYRSTMQQDFQGLLSDFTLRKGQTIIPLGAIAQMRHGGR